MYVDYSKPPFFDVRLPPAIIVAKFPLLLFYAILILVDFVLLKYRYKQKLVTSRHLILFMSICHAIIPLVITSDNPPLNLLYAAAPWFLLTHTAHMPVEDLTLWTWIESLFHVTMDMADERKGESVWKVRLDGLAKISLGVFKFCFMHCFIDPILPRRHEIALEYPWFSVGSMVYTLIYGIKAYLMLGIVDIFMGAEQTITGWRMIYLFNSPILSYSPRDFWSRRWNRIVRNLLHAQVFSRNNNHSNKKEEDDAVPKAKLAPSSSSSSSSSSKQKKGFWSTRDGRGLLSFIVSGAFHELIIMSCCRRMTFENMVFFTLQGVAVFIEVKLRQGVLKQEPTGFTRIGFIFAHLLFMMWMGRLFIAPFIRYKFLE